MSLSITAVPYGPAATPPEEPPAKRQKTLACLRCRRRKQKCDEQRPCSNCARSNEACQEVGPRIGLGSGPYPPLPQTPGMAGIDIVALEERVARLEKAQSIEQHRYSRAVVASGSGNGYGGGLFGQELSPRNSIASTTTHTADHFFANGGAGPGASELAHALSARPSSSMFGPSQDGSGAGLGAGINPAWSTCVSQRPSPSLAGSAPAIGLLATFARSDDECQSPHQQSRPQNPAGHNRQFPEHNNAPGSVSPAMQPATAAPFVDRATEDAVFAIYRAKVHARYAFLWLDTLRGAIRRSQLSGSQPPWLGFFINMIYSIGLLLARPGDLPDSALGGGGNSPLQTSQDDGGSSRNTQRLQQHQQQLSLYRLAVTRHLGHVFAHPDRVLHVQAHLMLAMHALHSPSTERIIGIAGATMRYCVMAHLHLAEAEDDEQSPFEDAWLSEESSTPGLGAANLSPASAAAIRAQSRRRVFWSAYSLDRAVGAMFDLPCSVPDQQITASLFAHIPDEELEAFCAAEAIDADSGSSLDGGSSGRQYQHQKYAGPVSTALHIVHVRRIQSEILNMTLHRDFSSIAEPGAGGSSGATPLDSRIEAWQVRMNDRLERWRAMCDRVSAKLGPNHSSGFTSLEWLLTSYHLTMALQYRTLHPIRSRGRGSSGQGARQDESSSAPRTTTATMARALQACAQSCLVFRRLQMAGSVSDPYLALIAQFRCGLSIVHHCCFVGIEPVPQALLNDMAEALKACSVALSVMAERWPQSRPLRDVFDLLVSETRVLDLICSPHSRSPHHHKHSEDGSSAVFDGNARTWRRIGSEVTREVLSLLPALEPIVVHRDTLRMARQIVTEDIFSTTEASSRHDGGGFAEVEHVKLEGGRSVSGNAGAQPPGLGISMESDVAMEGGEDEEEEVGSSIYAAAAPGNIDVEGGFRPASPEFFLPEPDDEDGHGEPDGVVDRASDDDRRRHYDYLDLGMTANSLDPALHFS